MNKLRIRYGIIIFITIILGLASRYFSSLLASWVNVYLGDILYGLMFYYIFSFIFINSDRKKLLLITIIYLSFIEVSQLYRNEFLDNLRNTLIGHLVLGKGFLLSDIFSYILGSLIGYFTDKKVRFL